MKIKVGNNFAVDFLTHVVTICSTEDIKLATLVVFPEADVRGFKMAALQIYK